MPRGSRIAFDGGFYHVFNRGINKDLIFLDEEDYRAFLRRLSELYTICKYDHAIYTYILMPNHFHLLLQTKKTPLAKIMTSLLTSYSMRFNRRHGHYGTVFQNRYQSKLCDSQSYFLGASRYILLNAIHAGLATTLKEYPWSSFRELYTGSPYSIIDAGEVTRLIGETKLSKEAYREFLLEGIRQPVHEEEYGFERETAGTPRFNSLAQKKYLRRQRKDHQTM